MCHLGSILKVRIHLHGMTEVSITDTIYVDKF